jgi:class 3 adenylate cyclase
MSNKIRYRFFIGSIIVSAVLLASILTITSLKTLQVDRNFFHLVHEENEALLINTLRFGHAMMKGAGDKRYQSLIDMALKNKFVHYLAILDGEGNVIDQSGSIVGLRTQDYYDTDWLGNGVVLRETKDFILTSYEAEKVLSVGEYIESPDPKTGLLGEDHKHPGWVLVGVDISFLEKHYNDAVIQTFGIGISIFLLGMLIIIISWIVQRYELAHMAIDQLQKIKTLLSNFVPETVKKMIENDPEKVLLDKNIQDATVLFLDIEGFTTLVQKFPHDIVNRCVECYFSLFLDVIQKNGGDINETAGDGLMVIFLDSDPGKHSIRVNIGISSGEVYLGSTKMRGAGGDRWTFTASGKVTILAARLSEFGRGAQILVSEETASRNGAGFSMKPLGTVALKNLEHPSKIFQVVDF